MSGGLANDNSAGSGNAQVSVNGPQGGANIGQALWTILKSDWNDEDPSYELCKLIYVYHPLGARIADEPLVIAQSQMRNISIPDSPEALVKEAFEKTWMELNLDEHIFAAASIARIYGIGTIIVGAINADGVSVPANEPLDLWAIPDMTLYFSTLDPLNTSGSLVMNQNPNSPDFQKASAIRVQGETYHSSRGLSIMNERPIYIQYSSSAFGYVGRSAYQRALFPLKSFINTMRTDDLITRKAGVFIAAIKQAGSILNAIMGAASGFKRQLLKEAEVDNVLSIDPDERIETLNMQNIDGAYGMARTNILENIAAAVPMPAILLNSQTYVDGFGEGAEDAKKVAHFIHRTRLWMARLYAFCDRICMHKAWTPEFYKTVQAQFPEQYEGMDYKAAFYQWKNSYRAEWPSLLIEPESERAKGEDVKLKAMIAMLEVLLPALDPDNSALLVEWAAANMNDMKMLFSNPLVLDFDSLEQFMEDRAEQARQAAETGMQAGGDQGANGEPDEKAPPPESGRE
jgi:hypothetical protein